MVKSLSHIIISGLLLVSVSGLTINMHYCHGQLIDLAVNNAAHSCCDTGMDDDQCGHCQDETIAIQPVSDFVGTEFSFELSKFHSTVLLFPTASAVNIPVARDLYKGRVINFKEPPGTGEVVLSRIQTFLI